MKRIYKTFYLVMLTLAVSLLINNVSAQVVIDDSPDSIAVVGKLYAYQMKKISGITYTLDVALEDMHINDGLITWIPSGQSKGGRVVVKATNGVGQTATKTFYIYVTNGLNCTDNNIIGYWKLNEHADTSYVDYCGSNNASNVGGALLDTAGVVERSQKFYPPSDNKLIVPHTSTLDFAPGDDFSIEFWYNNRLDDLTSNYVMLGRNEGPTGKHWWIGMNDVEDVQFYMRLPLDNYLTFSLGKSSSYNKWYHVFLVRDGTAETLKLYRNELGQITIDESAEVSYNGSNDGFTSTANLSIGWLQPGNPVEEKYQYDGRMDEVVLYDKALTSGEISGKFGGGTANPAAGYNNFQPLFRTVPPASVNEGSSYTYQCLATDLDGGNLTYDTITGKVPSWLSWNPATRTLSGTPTNDDVGINNVGIKVYDQSGFDINQNFQITVINVNDKPVLSGLETAALDYKEDDGKVAVTSSVVVTDVDNANIDSARVWISANYDNSEDMLAFTNTANITGVWNATTGSLKLTGTTSKANYQAALRSVTYENTNTVNPGTLTRTVSLTVNDGALNSTVVTRNITVESVNDCPVISAHAALSTPEEDTILVKLDQLTFTDVDDGPGSFSISVASGSNYTFAGNIVTPAMDFAGTLNINVRLTDSKCTVDYVLPVTVTGIEDAPRFNFASLPLDAYEGQTYLLKIRAYDPDAGDVVSYSVTQKPAWLNVISDTILTGVPEFADIGANDVTIRISDGTENTDTSFTITVHSSNYIPHITSTPPATVNEDELYLYNIVVVDTNSGDPLIMTAPILPSWLTLNTSQQTLTGTPTNDQVGTEASVDYTVQLKVSDGKQDSTQTFVITVVNVNDPPVINGQADTIRTWEGHSDTIKLSNLDVEDVDNLLSQLTLSVLPGTGYSISGNVITINTSTLGLIAVNVRVSDGSLFDEGVYYVKATEPSGVNDLNVNSGNIKVYPNPASDFIMFESDTEGTLNIEILDITGKLVYRDTRVMNGTAVRINTSDMREGLYFYRVSTNKETLVGSIVIDK